MYDIRFDPFKVTLHARMIPLTASYTSRYTLLPRAHPSKAAWVPWVPSVAAAALGGDGDGASSPGPLPPVGAPAAPTLAVFVPTAEAARACAVVQLLLRCGRHVLLLGGAGCGKSAIAHAALAALLPAAAAPTSAAARAPAGPGLSFLVNLPLAATCTAASVRARLLVRLPSVDRRTRTVGASAPPPEVEGESGALFGAVFIDDLHEADASLAGVSPELLAATAPPPPPPPSPLALLRSWLDAGRLHGGPGAPIHVAHTLAVCCARRAPASTAATGLPPRLARHLAPVLIAEPDDAAIRAVFSGALCGALPGAAPPSLRPAALGIAAEVNMPSARSD